MTGLCQHPQESMEVLFRAHDYVTRESFQVGRCTACGLVRTLPAPDPLDSYYPGGYYGPRADRRFPAWVEKVQGALYRRRARLVEHLANGGPGSRVLDIGCGRGMLLLAFRTRGWDVHGTELSDRSALHAREHLRIPVTVGEAARLPWPDGHFDAVILWHVLEHMRDPVAGLIEAVRILRRGGAFLVGVPNFASFEARLTRDRWFHLDVPRHLSHFTPATLHAALIAAGLGPRKTSFLAPEYDLFSFVQSALNALHLRHNLLYEMLRGNRASVLQGPKAGIGQSLLSLALAAPLGLLSLPAVAIAAALRSGATLTVIGTKQSPHTAEISRARMK